MRLSRDQKGGASTGGCSNRKLISFAVTSALAMGGLLAGGCDVKSFIDPGEMGRYRLTPLQKPIITSLSSLDRSIDDPEDEFVNASDVKPHDLDALARDYVIGKNDLVNVSVTDLVGPGVETTKTTRVSESGNISLPLIGQIHAVGQTEAQLEQTIIDGYRNANLIQNAQVSVTVAEARARTFSALGAVGAAGQYAILQSDFRMLDALVLMRDVSQGVDTVYVIRQISEDPENAPKAPANPAAPTTNSTDVPASQPSDNLAPHTQATPPVSNIALMATTGDFSNHPVNGGSTSSNGTTSSVTNAPNTGSTGPNGGANNAGNTGNGGYPANPGNTAYPVNTPYLGNQVNPQTPAGVPGAGVGNGQTGGNGTGSGPHRLPTDIAFQFSAPTPPGDSRVIRVPLDPLRNGDLRYNIVIRPHDLIIAPSPVTGEYYMGGHVARVGVYSLTARRITLKQAIISAGMLDGVAIPQRTDLIRRIGTDREVFARIDLDAIFAGTQPDIYLKPNDQLMVGTNILAPFIAAVRGGFRISYGFGFLYDRNFAPNNTGG